MKHDFFAHLGISGMYDTARYLAFAIEQNLPCFEIRNGTEVPMDLLEKWRNGGEEKVLSRHLPDLCGKDGFLRTENVLAAIRNGLALGCNRMTIHVPGFAVKRKDAVWEEMLSAAVLLTETAAAAGCRIGWENMHMTPGEMPDGERSYGYTIEECRNWILSLRKRVSRPELTGFHFDIGHAWNNAPYSETQTVSDWLRETGALVNGCHLHQISRNADGTGYTNHTPLTGLDNGLVSLLPVLEYWDTMTKPPLFLEIRGDMACAASYLALKNILVRP